MLHAIIHGKLSREIEEMEDVLTSSVFGTLRQLRPQVGILPFLALARGIDGRSLFGNWPDPKEWPRATVTYQFWPRLAESGCIACEPDLLLRMTFPPDSQWLVLVEAKYRSGKSSFADDVCDAPNDQLAREYDNLCLLARREGAIPALVYLTADIGMPRHELADSARDYRAKHPNRAAPFLGWVGWRMLHGFTETELHQDLHSLLERLNLIYFSGLRWPEPAAWSWRLAPTMATRAPFRAGLTWPAATAWCWTFRPDN